MSCTFVILHIIDCPANRFYAAGTHPVSINYVAADNVLDTVANVEAAGLKLYGAGPTIECASCHDPHGKPNVVGGGSDAAEGGEAFLRVAATAICTECHLK